MFDGVPDQFHQFIASSRASVLPIPFPFPLHATTTTQPPSQPVAPPFPAFDPYPSHQTLHHLHHHHHHLAPPQPKKETGQTTLVSTSLVLERERSAPPEPAGPWSNEEVVALLRIRSSMENWFPADFSWEHVSRKLGELGFKRSADKCKEKFEEEEESRNNNLNSLSFNKNITRFFTELDELYQQGSSDHHHQISSSTDHHNNKNHEESPTPHQTRRRDDNHHHNNNINCQSFEEGSAGNVEMVDHNNNMSINNLENEEVVLIPTMRSSATTTSSKSDNNNNNNHNKNKRKRNKRKREFEMFKGFCEEIVERIMAQQEELHNKIIEEMVKREEEKIARDEARKSQEIDRLNKEIEIREKEHQIASNRQAKIIDFLNKFSDASSNPHQHQSLLKKFEDLFDVTTNSTQPQPYVVSNNNTKKSKKASATQHVPADEDQNPISSNFPVQQSNTNSSSFPSPTASSVVETNKDNKLEPMTNPSSSSAQNKSQPSDVTHQMNNGGSGDLGKRWPREEVLALINLRCSLQSDNNNNKDDDNNNNNNNNKNNGGNKGPLWERISQGMAELGYNRSAKRCKEKWENINKYFRKTKDNNKKRSLDSRTCPYFHQLSTLYTQGKLIRGESPENCSAD